LIKEAIEKIVQLAGPTFQTIGEHTYSDKTMEEIRPVIDSPAEKSLTSLDAVVKLIKTEAAKLYPGPFYITIPAFDRVEVFGQPDAYKRYVRPVLYSANATDAPGWNPETKMAFEQAAVALQTRFQETPDQKYALQLLSQITCGGKVTYNDNGVAMSVVTSKGIALQENATIKPLISLKPYRTFQEIEQPTSIYLFRIDERGITFFEADGGMWKLTARQTIKAFFDTELADLIETGTVVVAL
jgi:hypothetical protein